MVAGPTGPLGRPVRPRVEMASENVTVSAMILRRQHTDIIASGMGLILLYVKATTVGIILYLVGYFVLITLLKDVRC